MDYSTERAADALAFINQSRTRLVAASDVPPSRHLAFAAMMGGLVVIPVLPFAMMMLADAVLALSIVLVIQWDKRRSGMFINGYRAGRTRWVTAALLTAMLPMYAVSYWLAKGEGLVWPSIALGLAGGALAYAGSIWWCRVFRREMLGGAA